MLHNDQVLLGDHCWATIKTCGSLVVILKVSFTEYYICGGWECKESFKDFDIISVIPVPAQYRKRSLAYYSELEQEDES